MRRAIHWVIYPLPAKRGDGYTRSEEKHVAGSSDALVAPVVVNGGLADETSLNNTAAAYSAMTGSDGTKILTITRPDTHGTKTSLTARLLSRYNEKSDPRYHFYRCNQSGQR